MYFNKVRNSFVHAVVIMDDLYKGYWVWGDEPKIKDDVGGDDEITVFGFTLVILHG